MANGKWTNNDMQKKILLYGELKIEQHDPDNNKKQGVNSCALECQW
jgi:hypothetical protein